MQETLVGDLVTTPVLTVNTEESAADVGHALRDRNIKSVVATDEDCRPSGIIPSTDFVAMAADDRTPSETEVGEYMTTDIVTTTPSEPLPEVAERMRDSDVSHLPVVGDEGRVIGILSATDLTESLSKAAATAGDA